MFEKKKKYAECTYSELLISNETVNNAVTAYSVQETKACDQDAIKEDNRHRTRSYNR